MMTQEIENRTIAFVRAIANRCSQCLYRREENCSRCDSRLAVRIMKDIELDKAVPQRDYSLFARMERITEILRGTDEPLFSHEIKLNGMCSNQLKNWTLKRMIRLGLIGRRLAFRTQTGRPVYRYFKKNKETKK